MKLPGADKMFDAEGLISSAGRCWLGDSSGGAEDGAEHCPRHGGFSLGHVAPEGLRPPGLLSFG